MTGAAFVLGDCFICGRMFTFNPNWVPSVPIDPHTRRPLDVDEHGNTQPIDEHARTRAVKEPICEDCMRQMNRVREMRGDDVIRISPHAYEASDPSGW